MKNIFEIAELCLFDCNINRKLSLTHQARLLLDEKKLSFQDSGNVQAISQTLFPGKPLLLMPRDMPRRKLDTVAGKAAFFHALAHIEFIAIYLAWDIIYRFRGLPDGFYSDWLRIADEEAQHFSLIRNHLLKYEIDYGDLPAHRGLWSHAEDTADNILARLAVVPRCMEARGVDVTPGMIEKLKVVDEQDGRCDSNPDLPRRNRACRTRLVLVQDSGYAKRLRS